MEMGSWWSQGDWDEREGLDGFWRANSLLPHRKQVWKEAHWNLVCRPSKWAEGGACALNGSETKKEK